MNQNTGFKSTGFSKSQTSLGPLRISGCEVTAGYSCISNSQIIAAKHQSVNCVALCSSEIIDFPASY